MLPPAGTAVLSQGCTRRHGCVQCQAGPCTAGPQHAAGVAAAAGREDVADRAGVRLTPEALFPYSLLLHACYHLQVDTRCTQLHAHPLCCTYCSLSQEPGTAPPTSISSTCFRNQQGRLQWSDFHSNGKRGAQPSWLIARSIKKLQCHPPLAMQAVTTTSCTCGSLTRMLSSTPSARNCSGSCSSTQQERRLVVCTFT